MVVWLDDDGHPKSLQLHWRSVALSFTNKVVVFSQIKRLEFGNAFSLKWAYTMIVSGGRESKQQLLLSWTLPRPQSSKKAKGKTKADLIDAIELAESLNLPKEASTKICMLRSAMYQTCRLQTLHFPHLKELPGLKYYGLMQYSADSVGK